MTVRFDDDAIDRPKVAVARQKATGELGVVPEVRELIAGGHAGPTSDESCSFSSRATLAIWPPEASTIATASALNSGVNFRLGRRLLVDMDTLFRAHRPSR